MTIVPYEELRDPRDFFELAEACFNEIAQPGHAPLLAMLRPGTVNARAGDKKHAFQVSGRFADVGPTIVRLIADSATTA